MKYLDEVGHLGDGAQDGRKSVDLGVAKVVTTPTGPDLIVSGTDAKAEPWQLRVPQVGGVGWTTVWSADFDANGRKDLLFAGYFPANGHCVNNQQEVTVLLFDDQARPAAWTFPAELPGSGHFPYVPVILRDLNRDGRAEFVTTECNWTFESDSRSIVKRSLTAIYEAQSGSLRAIRSVEPIPYARIAARIHHMKTVDITPPKSWSDPRPSAPSAP